MYARMSQCYFHLSLTAFRAHHPASTPSNTANDFPASFMFGALGKYSSKERRISNGYVSEYYYLVTKNGTKAGRLMPVRHYVGLHIVF